MKIEPKFITDRPYKHNRSMLEAIKRIKDTPKPIAMVSNVKEFQYLDKKL